MTSETFSLVGKNVFDWCVYSLADCFEKNYLLIFHISLSKFRKIVYAFFFKKLNE